MSPCKRYAGRTQKRCRDDARGLLFWQELEANASAASDKKPDGERQERVSALKRQLMDAVQDRDKEAAEKASYKKELRATKKLAKQALKRVAELEEQMRQDQTQAKSQAVDLQMKVSERE